MRDAKHHRLVLLSLERYLASKNLYHKHRKSEHVSNFGLHRLHGTSFANGSYDFGGQPPRTPNCSWSCCDSKAGVRIDKRQPILRQLSTSPLVDNDIRLSPQSQHDHTTEDNVETDLNAAIAAVEIQAGDQRDDLPLSNFHAGYQVNEGIPTPSRRQVATVRKKKLVSNFVWLPQRRYVRTNDARDTWGRDAMYWLMLPFCPQS